MVRIHGSWGHFVRPGKTDPKRYGTAEAMGLKKRKKRRRKADMGSAKPGEFRVWGEDGGLLYNCAEKKAGPVRELILQNLPVEAFDEVEGRIRKAHTGMGFQASL